MLWYKAWLETRWRFVIGLVVLVCSAAGLILFYPRALQLVTAMPQLEVGGPLGVRIQENVTLAREYRGYVWSQWFRQTLPQTGTLFAVLLGSGGVLASTAGPRMFTLSLPVSRGRLLGTRTAAGLLELFVLFLASALALPLTSPAVGETYSVGAAMVHGGCAFVAASVFYSIACYLSTVFTDMWRPPLVAIGVAIALNALEYVLHAASLYGVFGVMRGETYFRTGSLPWLGLLASAGASAALLYGSMLNMRRQDF
jgi:ABC-2 type transport system permease protein